MLDVAATTPGLMTAATTQFFATLGDKNLQVIVLLAVWCPFFGMRQKRFEETLMVALGASGALTVRLLLVGALQGVGLGWVRYILLITAPLTLWFLLTKVYLDYRAADSAWYAQFMDMTLEKSSGGSSAAARPSFRQDVFRLPKDPGANDEQQSSGYGAMGDSMEKTIEAQLAKVRGEKESKDGQQRGTAGPLTTALFSSLLATFAVSMADPLRGLSVVFGGFFTPFASILGAITAVVVAVLVGVLVERNLSERRFLLCGTAVIGMSALSVTTRVILLLMGTD